jgi:outer membrane protein, heavy metal efflux system
MGNFRLSLYFLSGALLMSCSLWGQQNLPDKFTLPQALAYARQHSPLLQAANEDVQAARGSEVTARLRPNPAFSLSSESYPLFTSSPGPFLDNQELTMTIEQPIETARKRYWRHRVASASREAIESQLNDAQRLLKLQVEQAHSEVLLAEADLESARSLLADYDRILAVQRARFNQGSVSGSELRRVEIERFRFLDDVLNSGNHVRNAKAVLLATIGYPNVYEDFKTEGSLEFKPLQQTLEQLTADALRYRPDVEAERFRVRQAQNEFSLQKANVVPNVVPYAGYKRDFGLNTLAFGVQVPLPIINRNQGEVARAQAERRGRDFRLLMTEQSVREEVAQAFNNFQTQERRLKELQSFYVARARESRDIAAESYRLGAVDLLVLLDTERTYRELVRTLNRARYRAVVGRFELEAAVGKEL